MILTSAVFIGILGIFTVPIHSLQCWNCVGSDCNVYRASSPNWELMTCPEGSSCQKTDFMFYSNQKNMSLEAYTVRSCSYETGCTWDRSKSCMKNPVEYAGRGCVDRYCCGRDQCNGVFGFNGFAAILMITITFGVFSML